MTSQSFDIVVSRAVLNSRNGMSTRPESKNARMQSVAFGPAFTIQLNPIETCLLRYLCQACKEKNGCVHDYNSWSFSTFMIISMNFN